MGYGVLIADLWVMVCISPPTKLVDGRGYGLKGVMGFQKYGLRGVRLYISRRRIFSFSLRVHTDPHCSLPAR